MIFFDFPGLNTHIFSFLFIHIKHICSPVLCVFVFGNYPKYLCKTVFFEMYYSSFDEESQLSQEGYFSFYLD